MSSFIKDVDEIVKRTTIPTTFYNAETLTVYWETSPEIIRRILPSPLGPGPKPLVQAFVADYPRTSFCDPYREAAIFVLAEYNGQLGSYCLSMPINDDIAMGLGRELYGFPKKMADISLSKVDQQVKGSVSRRGIEFFRVNATLSGRMNAEDGQAILNEHYGNGLPVFNIKYSKSADGNGFDLPPLLIQQNTSMDVSVLTAAEVEITLSDSPHDPWAELEVVKLLGGIYTVSNTVLLRGSVLSKVNPVSFLPYSYLRWDWWEQTEGYNE
ncbi:acetoacetate decarboxylase family protein [Paenibacillus sp. HW567]|uniref:acetoacetate decarboxylase family protein n=1 Tax=Paenibacillus sp. HW567 TaxID=1034769 RepID=UPI0003715920|nr:acetoacetate decarboxylase family protein [Paenibacillus sp. HW567]